VLEPSGAVSVLSANISGELGYDLPIPASEFGFASVFELVLVFVSCAADEGLEVADSLILAEVDITVSRPTQVRMKI
jgi:hypothetical protein